MGIQQILILALKIHQVVALLLCSQDRESFAHNHFILSNKFISHPNSTFNHSSHKRSITFISTTIKPQLSTILNRATTTGSPHKISKTVRMMSATKVLVKILRRAVSSSQKAAGSVTSAKTTTSREEKSATDVRKLRALKILRVSQNTCLNQKSKSTRKNPR